MSSSQHYRRVCVAVLTFHRPEQLGALLPLLVAAAEGHEAATPSDSVRIMVIDNDPAATAHPIVDAVALATVGSRSDRVRYVVETNPGISAGRNRAIDEAADCDLLVFIDDDETPRSGWLSALIAVHDEHRADVVSGPVVTQVEGGLDPWVAAGGFFDRTHHVGRPDGSPVSRAASNNLLLDLHTVRRSQTRFDDAFGLTGGEDSLFTGRLLQAGADLRWATSAVVNDHLPAERLSREYALRRTHQLYNSTTRVDLVLAGSRSNRAKVAARTAAVSALRIGVGMTRIGLGVVSRSMGHDARGRREVARGRGSLAALAGRYASPYGRAPETASGPERGAFCVWVAHPSADLYGSDLQLVETVRGLRDVGHRVVVALPFDGPLVARFTDLGATVRLVPTPVLRKSMLSPMGGLTFAAHLARSTWVLQTMLRRERPDALVVNTVTIPSWLLAARLIGVPTLCHVHEAEANQPRLVRVALAIPLLLARSIITNSRASSDVLTRSVPALRRRMSLVYNGIAGPTDPVSPRIRSASDPLRLVLVGRLSPRKGTDVALDALGRVRTQGVDASLVICGSVFPGYEWFEEELRSRAAEEDLCGHVQMLGYVASPAHHLAEADVVLVPSRVEPFGNAAVEALLAERPLIASRTQGLREIVRHHQNGILVTPGSAVELAERIAELAAKPGLAARLAQAGREDAVARFSVERYRRDMVYHVSQLIHQ